jgi:hypothetical protein
MANTPHLNITLLEQSQAQKEVTVNEAFYRIDALLNSGVIDKDLATPPGSPTQGDVYIVAASPTGDWAGKAKQVAYFDQIWRFIAPNEGLMLWVRDEDKRYLYDGAAWVIIEAGSGGGGGGSGDMLAATYDPANIAQQLVGTAATQTLTNKTLTAPTLNGIISGDAAQKLCQARLTLTTGVPVTSSDVTAASTIYITPYQGNHMALYNGTTWQVLSFTEISHSLTGATASRPHDIFAYNNAGTVAIEHLAWASDTARATALAIQNGVLVKSGAATRRYLGTVYVNASVQTEDSVTRRLVWNYYHRAIKHLTRGESTANWTYSTGAFRQVNNNTANQVEVMVGLSEDAFEAEAIGYVVSNMATARSVFMGIGIDSSTARSNFIGPPAYCSSTITGTPLAKYYGFLFGRQTIRWLEYGAGADTQTWYGAGVFTGIIASGRF